MILGVNYNEASLPFKEGFFSRKSLDKKSGYADYYSEETATKLAHKWKDILDIFGFNFYGLIPGRPMVVSGKNLRYSKKENRLWREK